MMQSGVRLAQFGKGLQPVVDNAFTQEAAVGTNAFSRFELIFSNLIGILTVLGGILFIGYFLLACLNWITSGGDSGKVSKATQQMLHAVLGLVILVSTYAIVGLLGSIFGLDLLNVGDQLRSLVPTP